jgi:hypothetical protein
MSKKNRKKNVTVSAHDVRRIAVEARCGDRSVRAFLHGSHLKELTRLRIAEAMAKLGFELASEVEGQDRSSKEVR